MCANSRCEGQKKRLSLNKSIEKVNDIKVTRKKTFEATEKAWNILFKPAVNVAAPLTGKAVGGKTKNLMMGQVLTNFVKSLSVGRILTAKFQHSGIGFRLSDMFLCNEIFSGR